MKQRNLILIAFTLCFMMLFSTTAFANEEITPYADGYYRWEVKSTSYVGDVTGPEQYIGDLGRGSGSERVYAEVKDSLTAEINGTLEVTKQELTAQLGFSVTQEFSISTGKYSEALNGRGAKAYYKQNYARYKVVQEQIYRIDGYDTVVGTKTIYVDKPLNSAQIRFVYYN